MGDKPRWEMSVIICVRESTSTAQFCRGEVIVKLDNLMWPDGTFLVCEAARMAFLAAIQEKNIRERPDLPEFPARTGELVPLRTGRIGL